MIKARHSYNYEEPAQRIIAVSSQKGGVGKSTTAVNVAAYLGEFGYRTILVDMDPQSNSTGGLGVDYKKLKKSIYNILIHNENPNNGGKIKEMGHNEDHNTDDDAQNNTPGARGA